MTVYAYRISIIGAPDLLIGQYPDLRTAHTAASQDMAACLAAGISNSTFHYRFEPFARV